MDDLQLVRVARALGDPTRLRIFQAIAGAHRACCGDVRCGLPVTQATVSHHLKILAAAGLVEGRREGQFVRVRAVPGALARFRRALARLARGPAAPPARRASPAPRPRRASGPVRRRRRA